MALLRYQKHLYHRAKKVKTPLTRRQLLKGLSLSTLSLTLPGWRSLEANTNEPHHRFMVFFQPNGTVPGAFFSNNPQAPTATKILSPLEHLKDRLLVLKGLHMDSITGPDKPGGPHMRGPGGLLTGGWLSDGDFKGAGGPAGYADRISVDQVVANHIGQNTPFSSLELSLNPRGSEPLKTISYRGAGQPNPAISDPWRVYERLFSMFSDVEKRELRGSVLDYVKGELLFLEKKLPYEERQRLLEHLNEVRQLEKRLYSDTRANCEAFSMPAKWPLDEDHLLPKLAKLQLDLLFLAHACDLTRVSSFMWTNANSWQKFPFLGISEQHHKLSHLKDEKSLAKLIKINKWYSEQLAYFLGRLEATQEPNGKTMLENSLVLVGNEIGEGNHTHKNIPFLLAGSLSSAIKQGELLDVGGRPHNDLLLSICHMFGIKKKSFGAPSFCTGVLKEIFA